MYTTHLSTTPDFRDIVIEEQRALIAELSIEPGFDVPTAAIVRRDMRHLAATDQRVDVYLGDADNLKQMNSATGHQPRTDELFHPALQVRACDALIYGKYDAGDQFLYVFPAGQGASAIERIERELALAPMTETERRAYVRGVCAKRYGPMLGWLRAALGWHDVQSHPTITFVGYEGVPASELSRLATVSDRALFERKAGVR